MSQLERRSVVGGAVVAIIVAGPAGVIAELVSSDDDSAGPLLGGLFLAVLVGFGLGGWFAARNQRETPLMHGAAAAALAFVIIQGVGAVRSLLTGEGVNVVAVVFSLFMAAAAGMFGAWIAYRSAARRG